MADCGTGLGVERMGSGSSSVISFLCNLVDPDQERDWCTKTPNAQVLGPQSGIQSPDLDIQVPHAVYGRSQVLQDGIHKDQ